MVFNWFKRLFYVFLGFGVMTKLKGDIVKRLMST